MRGKEFIEYDNPFDVGMTGLLGFSSGYRAMMNCDLLLMIGTDLPYQQFFPKDATIVQIDLRGEQLGRRTKVDLGLVGDTKSTLEALLPNLQRNSYEAHLKDSREHYRKAREGLDDLAQAIRAGNRSILNTSRACSINSPPKRRFSPVTSKLRRFGPRGKLNASILIGVSTVGGPSTNQ